AIAATKFQVRVHGQHPDASHGEVAHSRHGHRSWVAIRDLIAGSTLDAAVRERALAVFARLAEAEALVHGVPVERVEFHEVGALDAIVDVVGAAPGFIHLGIETVHVSALPVRHGLVQTAHGPLPVPGPGVRALLRGGRVGAGDGSGGLAPPAGAALVAGRGPPAPAPPFRLGAVGYGAGDRAFAGRPTLLRPLIGEPMPALESDEVVVL